MAERFDPALEPNEPNRHGYIVEIDPANSVSRPRKHTALGRFKHENCEMVMARDGHIVAYVGDDEREKHLYKFVSSGTYRPVMDNPSRLLEDGILHAARFDDGGTGVWLALTPDATGMDKAEICINTRLAATAAGATTMDRPEWVAANPQVAEAYCCLTNNKDRGKSGQPVNGVNSRPNNQYGQIVRWISARGNHASRNFKWGLFVMVGNPNVHQDAYAGSSNITSDNMFNSPDGLTFDSQGRLWIQTDGNYSNTGDFSEMGNNQMMLADAGTSAICRFLVGPKECEVTGVTWSPDHKTMFVGIQHPGERHPHTCHFPGDGASVPRSSVIAIEKAGWLGLGRAVVG
ncbi:PhoX family protein [Candidatus Synechococcus spongiarum]|uniref:Putative phosphatase n=1 Tax=Candidatus Synechococcus spongiarum TaxID=431041 RepID=A0A164ZSX9_9SYNE|nr:alkaline phosphatase PhoX [Candidatus Synechococcus spongiarum]SAY39496.1 Putative phosphatase [Candidatus Synechococcus spongiarum]